MRSLVIDRDGAERIRDFIPGQRYIVPEIRDGWHWRRTYESEGVIERDGEKLRVHREAGEPERTESVASVERRLSEMRWRFLRRGMGLED